MLNKIWDSVSTTNTTFVLILFQKKFKKISKRNLPNVGMGGWMEALADKGHKQGEQLPQHYISHNHPYISSSGY